MGTVIWCEDTGSGYEFWKTLFGTIHPDFTVESKDNNSNLRKAAEKIKEDSNKYYLLMDQAVDNPDVLRELNKLKKIAEGKENVELIKIHSFEFVLLSFKLLEEWVFAKEDELKEKRADYLRLKTLFLKSFLGEMSTEELEEYRKGLEAINYTNSEQLVAKLLFEITRNTGFETDKKKLGTCFINNCCEWEERQEDDICGLDDKRLTSVDKKRAIVEYSVLKNELSAVGL